MYYFLIGTIAHHQYHNWLVGTFKPTSLNTDDLVLEKLDVFLNKGGRYSPSPSRKRSCVLRESNFGRVGGEVTTEVESGETSA